MVFFVFLARFFKTEYAHRCLQTGSKETGIKSWIFTSVWMPLAANLKIVERSITSPIKRNIDFWIYKCRNFNECIYCNYILSKRDKRLSNFIIQKRCAAMSTWTNYYIIQCSMTMEKVLDHKIMYIWNIDFVKQFHAKTFSRFQWCSYKRDDR